MGGIEASELPPDISVTSLKEKDYSINLVPSRFFLSVLREGREGKFR